MRIVISLLNFRPGQIGGAETYLRGLLTNLPQVAGGDKLISVCHSDNAEALDVPGIERIVVPRGDRQIVRDRMLEAASPYHARTVYQTLAASRPDVVLYPQQSIFPKKTAWPAVLTVLDLQHEIYPENFRLSERIFRRCIYDYSLRKADHMIAISESTKRSVVRRHNVPPGQIDVVRLGFDAARCEGIEPYTCARPYLYYPAASFRHKGHVTLLRSVGQLVASGEFPYQLIFSGQKTAHWSRIERVIDECGLRDRVTHLGFVAYQQVLGLYQGAAAVLFPTDFEGFGLPALEAVAMGKKLVVSRLEVFDEIGVPHTCQIDFAMPEQLRGALADLSPTDLLRQPTTWHETAEQTLRVLHAAIN